MRGAPQDGSGGAERVYPWRRRGRGARCTTACPGASSPGPSDPGHRPHPRHRQHHRPPLPAPMPLPPAPLGNHDRPPDRPAVPRHRPPRCPTRRLRPTDPARTPLQVPRRGAPAGSSLSRTQPDRALAPRAPDRSSRSPRDAKPRPRPCRDRTGRTPRSAHDNRRDQRHHQRTDRGAEQPDWTPAHVDRRRGGGGAQDQQDSAYKLAHEWRASWGATGLSTVHLGSRVMVRRVDLAAIVGLGSDE
jgi:hypothetical protein